VIPRNVQITLVLLLVAVFGSGVYILQLHKRTEENLRRASDRSPVAPPLAGTPATIKLTIAYDDDGVFRSRDFSPVLPFEPSARAKAILETLIAYYVNKPSPHPLADGAGVNSVFLVNQKLAVVDLNQALAEGHRSGIMVEDFTLMSLIDSLTANFPQLERVKVLVDGKERETLAGHADLRSTYNAAAVHKIVEELQ
jgi:hypothetical protein